MATSRITQLFNTLIQPNPSDLNNLRIGVAKAQPSTTTHLPNTTNTAWIVMSFVWYEGGNNFGFQIAFGYSPNEVYSRRAWAGWENWVKLSN